MRHSIGQVTHHGAHPDQGTKSLLQAKRLFDLPLEVKQMIRHPPSADDHRGYVEVGFGRVTQDIWDPSEVQKIKDTTPVEQKELLEAGNPYSENDRAKNPYPNRFLPDTRVTKKPHRKINFFVFVSFYHFIVINYQFAFYH